MNWNTYQLDNGHYYVNSKMTLYLGIDVVIIST